LTESEPRLPGGMQPALPDEPAPPPPSPAHERIEALDVLRGVAVLGIFAMNVTAFAMPRAVYSNPAALGELAGADLTAWLATHIFVELKFMTIFSLLFGAGIAMIAHRIEIRGGASGKLHLRRMWWLFVFGLLHAYLLWYGDILVTYAICGLVVWLFRNVRPKYLLLIAVLSISIPALMSLLTGLSIPLWPDEARAHVIAEWEPPPEAIAKETSAYRGGWIDQMSVRAPTSLMMQTTVLFFFALWRVAGVMLLGVAALRWGIVTASRPSRFYLRMAAAGAAAGFPLVAIGAAANVSRGFDWTFSMFYGMLFNYVGSLFIAACYVALVMLAVRSGRFTELRARFAAVGRAAFSNYILQTLIGVSIFYGTGLGLFGRVGRPGQMLIVAAVWALALVVSPLWLRHFRMGPLEWLWRSLTYGTRPPMRA
jgi:uncharacterized protein